MFRAVNRVSLTNPPCSIENFQISALLSVLFAGLAFGLIHPGGKWILDQGGLTLLPFVLFCVGFRVLFQLPILFATKAYRVRSFHELGYLLLFGVLGAALRITEMVGIVQGLAVSTVSFLVFTHPLWTLLYCSVVNRESVRLLPVIRVLLGFVGICLITQLEFLNGMVGLLQYAGPLSAGMVIALWICFSRTVQDKGIQIVSMSFYYDFFSFLVLLSVVPFYMSGTEWTGAIHWIISGNHLLQMSVLALVTGVLPNYLFYYGAKTIPPLVCALILLIEPVFSSVVSYFIWHDPLNIGFFVGATCVLFTNVPQRAFHFAYARLPKIQSPLAWVHRWAPLSNKITLI